MAKHNRPSPFCGCGCLFIEIAWLRVCAQCDGDLLAQLRYRWSA